MVESLRGNIMAITILGLGPGPEQMTGEVRRLLEGAEELYLRTRHHPAVDGLPGHLRLHSFDYLYQEAEDFEEVYQGIAEKVVELGRRPEGVIYAVPGHPLVGEKSVRRILALAKEEGMEVRIVPGLSFIDLVLPILGLDLLSGLQMGDATALAFSPHPHLDPDTPALIGQLHSRSLASDLKLTLMNLYPDDHPVVLIHGAGSPEAKVQSLPLYELDHDREIDQLTCLFIPPLSSPGSFSAMQEVVARLRAPDGCPWDREQTHRSLRPYLLEETYEALEALDREEEERLCEELGDLLLQILLHVQIAIEGGEFKMSDVLGGIVAKLIRRHPHVFGEAEAQTPGEVISQWQEIKREEGQLAEGPLADIPVTMPALARAQRIQGVAPERGLMARAGEEELLGRLKEGLARLSASSGEEAEEAMGDLLFDLVALANLRGVDAESALREKLRGLEEQIKSRGERI